MSNVIYMEVENKVEKVKNVEVYVETCLESYRFICVFCKTLKKDCVLYTNYSRNTDCIIICENCRFKKKFSDGNRVSGLLIYDYAYEKFK